MKFDISKSEEEINISISELRKEDFDWVFNYFKAILELKLPVLLEELQ